MDKHKQEPRLDRGCENCERKRERYAIIRDSSRWTREHFERHFPSRIRISESAHPVEEIFDRGLLDGRTFEAGGHGLFWGNKSRIECLMRHFGSACPTQLNRGLGFVA